MVTTPWDMLLLSPILFIDKESEAQRGEGPEKQVDIWDPSPRLLT
jgi:hypothetical protein